MVKRFNRKINKSQIKFTNEVGQSSLSKTYLDYGEKKIRLRKSEIILLRKLRKENN